MKIPHSKLGSTHEIIESNMSQYLVGSFFKAYFFTAIN